MSDQQPWRQALAGANVYHAERVEPWPRGIPYCNTSMRGPRLVPAGDKPITCIRCQRCIESVVGAKLNWRGARCNTD